MIKFTEDDPDGQKQIVNPEWKQIAFSLNKINPNSKAYFMLENADLSYVQCCGAKDSLCIEFREVHFSSFKHFTIEKKSHEKSLNTVWATINSKVGPVHVLQNEVLTLLDALNVFKSFFENNEIPDTYCKRNVTKQFLK
jgi:hypothetical protein